jgi:hypothetical protein
MGDIKEALRPSGKAKTFISDVHPVLLTVDPRRAFHSRVQEVARTNALGPEQKPERDGPHRARTVFGG